MSPAQLFTSRTLRTNLKCSGSAEVTYIKGNDLRASTGIVLSKIGKRILNILDLNDLSNHGRHIDQICFNYNQFDFENTNLLFLSRFQILFPLTMTM